MADEFIDMCAVCKQGVSKIDMVYQKGKVFHSQCFTEHGGSFTAPDSELAQLSARTRIELVQLKNMKVRVELEKQNPKTQSKPVEKNKRKMTKRKSESKRRKPKIKAKRVKKSKRAKKSKRSR